VAIATSVMGQSADQKARVPILSEIMGILDYAWEPLEVTTDDGYVLNLIHVTTKGWFSKDSKGPLLVEPTYGLSIGNYLGAIYATTPKVDPVVLQLSKDGYDVYLSYPRGQGSSDINTNFKNTSAEFWDWTFSDIAMHDITAQTKFISERTHKKVNYLSMGTSTAAAFVAMSENNAELSQYVNKIALLEPCLIWG